MVFSRSGWITGHSYLAYGPLLCGCTIVVMGGLPNYPDGGRIWRMVERYKVRMRVLHRHKIDEFSVGTVVSFCTMISVISFRVDIVLRVLS